MASSIKTAISMHEDLFREVNKIAKELNVSRSRLFVMAMQDFIKKQENKKMIDQINRAFSDSPDTDEKKLQAGMRKKQIRNLGEESW
jgi:metal-responsive CopG/Arc/MetJ family transcriptional regulator